MNEKLIMNALIRWHLYFTFMQNSTDIPKEMFWPWQKMKFRLRVSPCIDAQTSCFQVHELKRSPNCLLSKTRSLSSLLILLIFANLQKYPCLIGFLRSLCAHRGLSPAFQTTLKLKFFETPQPPPWRGGLRVTLNQENSHS